MTDYLYIMTGDFSGVSLAKVGVSVRPRDRMTTIASNAPFEMTIQRLKGFECRQEADAWERYVLNAANRYRDRGEWVLNDEHLLSVWDKVDGGTDIDPDDYSPMLGRPIPDRDDEANVRLAYVEKFRHRVGPVIASHIGYTGHPALYDRAIIQARLKEGYGIEDIAILDGISTNNIRREILRLRMRGKLSALYTNKEEAA